MEVAARAASAVCVEPPTVTWRRELKRWPAGAVSGASACHSRRDGKPDVIALLRRRAGGPELSACECGCGAGRCRGVDGGDDDDGGSATAGVGMGCTLACRSNWSASWCSSRRIRSFLMSSSCCIASRLRESSPTWASSASICAAATAASALRAGVVDFAAAEAGEVVAASATSRDRRAFSSRSVFSSVLRVIMWCSASMLLRFSVANSTCSAISDASMWRLLPLLSEARLCEAAAAAAAVVPGREPRRTAFGVAVAAAALVEWPDSPALPRRFDELRRRDGDGGGGGLWCAAGSAPA